MPVHLPRFSTVRLRTQMLKLYIKLYMSSEVSLLELQFAFVLRCLTFRNFTTADLGRKSVAGSVRSGYVTHTCMSIDT